MSRGRIDGIFDQGRCRDKTQGAYCQDFPLKGEEGYDDDDDDDDNQKIR
jgi:hypothetical protein